MTDAPELKPCPFCGGDADLMTPEDDNMRLATAMCMGCYITGPEKETEAEAITAWNTRADLTKPRVKPLVWHHITSTGDRNVHEAKSLLGRYTIWPDGSWRLKGHYVGGYGEVRSLSGAKAAAQADYEARVLVCLEGE